MASRDWKESMKRKKERELTLDDIDVESDLNIFTYQASQIRLTLEHTLPEGSYSVEDIFDPYIAVDDLENAGDKLAKRIPLLKKAVKEAKAFEIIKSKRVDVDRLIDCFQYDDCLTTTGLIEYHSTITKYEQELTQEEYDLLKKVLS